MGYILDYVYPSKAKAIAEAGERFRKVDSAIVETYDNAIILPAVKFNDYDVSHGRGGVIDEKGNYVELSKQKARVQGYYDPYKYGTEDSSETVVYCGFFNKAWGHYITESISRLWYALKNDESVDAYVFFDVLDGNKHFSGNYLELLKLLGIADKVKIINRPTKFNKVIIPEEGFVYNDHYTQKFIDFFQFINKKGLDLYNGEKYEKVFFSKRKLIISAESNLNEKFLDNYFKKNGYKVFYPEQLSLIDTIGILQNAECFAGIASSLLHNQLFGTHQQTTICIEKQAFYNPYQVMVAKITDCKTVFIDACRSVFAVGSAGPFIFDYTSFLDQYAKDNQMILGKPMSEWKFKRIFKRYLAYYFDLNVELPPDWMYRQYIIDMTREAYNDTVKSKKVFRMPLYNRIVLKIKKTIISKR